MRTKLSVFGYIRSKHILLFKSNQYQLFENIPISISSLCTLYYHSFDYFRSNLASSTVKITKNDTKIMLKEISNGADVITKNSSFGNFIISSEEPCIYKWYLNINDIKSRCQVIVGISSYPWVTDNRFYWNDDNRYYAYKLTDVWEQLRSHDDDSIVTTEYGQWQGDISLCMEVNMKQNIISFDVNGETQGNAFKNVENGSGIEYRLSITVHCVPSVTITKFTQEY